MKLKGEKILVTGGAGFIGSHLCDRFVALGAVVVCLDNLSTGSIDNIAHLMDHPQFTFIQGDIRDREVCDQAIAGCSMASHQAALGSVPRSIAHPQDTMSVNVQGFVNICMAGVAAQIKKLVYASSSSIYGDAPELPKTESVTGRALSPYALSKQVNESFAEQCRTLYGLDAIGLRYFNVFGPRQSPQGAYAAVIPCFIQAAAAANHLVINGEGTNTRDFTYIDNIVALNVLALTAKDDLPHHLFNGAAGGQISIRGLAEMVVAEFNVSSEQSTSSSVTYGPTRPGDIPHSFADISRSTAQLGYVPCVSFEQGLRTTINYFQSQHPAHV